MKMPVNQTGREISAFQINGFFGFVIAQTNDAAIRNRDVGVVNFSAQDVHQLRVFKQ